MSLPLDLRGVFNVIRKAPKKMDDVLRWAEQLVQSLQRNEKDANAIYTPDYASTIDFSLSISNILILDTVHAIGNCTINGRVGKVGPVWIIINNDATSGKVITFGTGFLSAGTLTGTASKTAVVEFISDGSAFYEVSRKTGL